MYIRHNFSILDTKIVGELCLALAERRQRGTSGKCRRSAWLIAAGWCRTNCRSFQYTNALLTANLQWFPGISMNQWRSNKKTTWEIRWKKLVKRKYVSLWLYLSMHSTLICTTSSHAKRPTYLQLNFQIIYEYSNKNNTSQGTIWLHKQTQRKSCWFKKKKLTLNLL